ncbi:kinesin-like protein KIF23 isoform X1 [Portunus trituberculatus]|uniref:kinesin-like protein KIF23 isoform X1 n=2 Tax=Portunus trituberculatus TaxID=210409 RepID=UPI001E1D0590|nr:kinesin-like protein KIF23 isoform X1 [Portunus trituberculatus]
MKPDRTPMQRRPRLPPKPRTVERKVEQDPVEVFCRIRPAEIPGQEECIAEVDSRTVKLTPPNSSFAYRNGSAKEQLYKFGRVFGPSSSQKELFSRVAMPLVSDLVNGRNGLLFAYGVTGSGKTYTMQGTPQDGGIIRRTLDVLFNSIQDYQASRFTFRPDGMNGFDAQSEVEAQNDRRKAAATQRLRPTAGGRTTRGRKDPPGSQDNSQRIPDTSRIDSMDEDNVYSVFVSYIEIYNNYLYDLLEDLPETGPSRGLQTKIIREDAQHNMYVHACTEVEVKSPEDGLEVLYRGLKRRKIASTRLNCESSRSHSIFTIRLLQAPLDAQGEDVVTDKSAIVVSQLSLVDLAGSERNLRTKAAGDRIKEAGNINNSLMNLRICIEILRENQEAGGNKKVPYRDSKLTHYFKNFFDGDGKVRMVVCVNPRSDDYDETLTVMKFAELASEVQIQRSQPARRDLGLPPGRRRANQLFKEVRKKLEDEVEGASVEALEVDLAPIYSLAPDWPVLTSSTPGGLEEVITRLKAHLRKRLQSRERLEKNFWGTVAAMRSGIAEMEKENLVMKKELMSMKALYSDAMGRVRSLESLLHNAESANESLQRKLEDQAFLRDECEAVKEERDMAKVQSQIEKQRMRAKLRTKLEQEKMKLKSTLNNEINNQKSKIYQSQVKALQQALFSDKQTIPTTPLQPSTTSSSDTDLTAIPGKTPIKASTSDPKLNMTPASHRTPAVVNLRHRRSRSQGSDVWIDHRPTQEVPTGTILQPNLHRRKSVTKLKSGDFTDPRTTNYCLTTQEQDSQGELETKLFKGEVLPTAGGGAQVVLRDVEILHQRDPLQHQSTPNRKRSSTEGTPLQDRGVWSSQKRPRV